MLGLGRGLEAGGFGDLGEDVGVADGQIGENFAINLDIGFF